MKKKQLLNEIMGVPRAVDFWVTILSEVLLELAEEALSYDPEEATVRYKNAEGEDLEDTALRVRTGSDGKESNKLILKVLGYPTVKELLLDERFKSFPLYKPEINLTIMFLPKDLFELTYGKDGDSVEASHAFDTTEKALSKIGVNTIFVNQKLSFEITLPKEQYDTFDESNFKKKLKPTISHELTHAYEMYVRVLSNKDIHQGRETFLNTAARLMDDFKYPTWKRFLHLVYLHLYFEINARVTQLYYEMKEKDVSTMEEFMDVLKKSTVWEEIQRLENFDAEKFMEDFTIRNLEIEEYIKDIGQQTQRKIQGLPIIEPKDSPEEGMKHLIEGWNTLLQFLNKVIPSGGGYKGKLMDEVPKNAKENPYYFFKFFENRFHKKAERFKRRVYKLASLVLDKSLMGESIENRMDCPSCGHSWGIDSGDNDPNLCHICGYDCEQQKYNPQGLKKFWDDYEEKF